MSRMNPLLAFGSWLAAASVGAQQPDHAHATHDAVTFEVSCVAHVRPLYEEAVAMLHSFGYEEARRAFQEVARQDAGCAMAHWGIGMTYYHPLWAPPTPDELRAGRAAAERAAALRGRTDRERAYIAAVGAFYTDADRLDHRTRAAAYSEAMERVVTAHPDDDEAAILFALSILGSAPPSDPGFTSQRRAATILAAQLTKHPNHPGIAHYTIHAFDYPGLAQLALPAARVYAELAPESPHARHMPTHIFTRLGLWRESIASNVACRDLAAEIMRRDNPGRTAFEAMHCQDYMAYAHLQLGEDEAARAVLQSVSRARAFDDPNFAVGYAVLAVPARYALERRDWSVAASLTVPDIDLRWEFFRESQGSTFLANAVGSARLGDLAGAEAAVEALGRLQAQLAGNPPAGPYDWAGQVESMWLAAQGWLAFAEGRSEEAVRLLTRAAVQEEVVGKHPVTPGAVLPAREQLADALLELGRAEEALIEYEAVLEDAPGRFNALAGAARAARSAGDLAAARMHYSSLIDQAGDATHRAAVQEARAFLGAG